MKRIIEGLIIVCTLFFTIIPASAKSGDWWSVEWFNDNIKNIKQNELENGVSYIALHDFVEYLDGDYTYNSDTKEVVIKQNGKELFVFNLEDTDRRYVKLALNPILKDGEVLLLASKDRLKLLLEKYSENSALNKLVRENMKTNSINRADSKAEKTGQAFMRTQDGIPYRFSKNGYTIIGTRATMDPVKNIHIDDGVQENHPREVGMIENMLSMYKFAKFPKNAEELDYIEPEYSIQYTDQGYAQIVLCNYEDYDSFYTLNVLSPDKDYNFGMRIENAQAVFERLDGWKSLDTIKQNKGVLYTVQSRYRVIDKIVKVANKDRLVYAINLSKDGNIINTRIMEIIARDR